MIDPIYAEALHRFQELFESAWRQGLKEPSAMALATVNADNQPAVRIVLLRGHDARGFVFYTNGQSRKGDDLRTIPRAALCLYWDPLAIQVRIEGNVEFTSVEENDAYWNSRPRMSQIASAASDQSRLLVSRETYELRARELDASCAGSSLPRPPHWIGYRVVPTRIEFWTGREARMHERDLYELTSLGWQRSLLYP